MRRRTSHDPLNLFLPDIERYINIGAWQYHPDTDRFSWSENLYQIFEVDKSKVNGNLDSYLGLFHSDDSATVRQAIKKCIDNKTSFTLNSRIQNKGGQTKTLRIWGGAITDKDGAVTAISGTCIDISGQQKLENQLWESEELNKKLLENTDNIIILQDKDQNVVYLNKNAIYASGYIINSLNAVCDFDHFFSDEDLSKMKSIFTKVIKKKKPAAPKIIKFHTADEKTRTGEFKMFPFDHRGETLVLTIIKDITETIEIYEALKASEDKLKLLIRDAPISIAMFNNKMEYIACSKRYIKDWWTDKSVQPEPEDITGKNHYELFPDVTNKWREAHKKALNGAVIKSEEDHFIKQNGKREWVRSEIHPWFEKENIIGGVVLFSEFITERKVNELILLENEAKQRALLSNLPGIVFSSKNDDKRTVTYLSDAVSEILENDLVYFKKNKIGLNDIIESKDQPGVRNAIAKALEAKKSYHVVYRIRLKNKKILTVSERGQGIYTRGGKVKSIEGVIFNITEQEKARKEKDDIARRNNALLKAIPDLIIILNKEGKCLYVEKGDGSLVNGTKADLIGKSIKDELPKEVYKKFKNRIKLALKEGHSLPFEYSLTTNEKRRYFEARIAKYKKDKVLCMIREISDLKEKEKLIVASEERFFKSLHMSPIPVVIVNIKNRTILDVNEQFERFIDVKAEDIKDKKEDILNFWHNRTDRLSFFKMLMEHGRVEQYETIVKTHSDELKNIVMSAEIIEINKEKAVLIMLFDVTERKKAENDLIHLTEELRSSNEELKQFAYITSHNFRAPVVNIESLLEFYNKKNPADNDNILIIENLERSVSQLKETLNDLIELVAIKDGVNKKNQEVNFEAVINRVLKSNDKLLRESSAVVKTNLQVPNISIKKAILESIIYNFISNAIKYRHPQREPKIKISTYNEKNSIMLVVEDNGIGIDLEKYGDKLFGLYQRLHKSVEGKGLGLYIVKSQVENMGGTIEVKSKVGTGTKFFVSFPD